MHKQILGEPVRGLMIYQESLSGIFGNVSKAIFVGILGHRSEKFLDGIESGEPARLSAEIAPDILEVHLIAVPKDTLE